MNFQNSQRNILSLRKHKEFHHNLGLFIRLLLLVCGYSYASTLAAQAGVNYDRGRLIIEGVQLLQDSQDPTKYRYIPQFPRLASRDDGTPEILVMKYVDPNGDSNGGLFHALIEFTLPDELLDLLNNELQELRPGSEIVGPVDLLPTLDEDGGEEGSFKIVSAVLSAGEADDAPASFNSSVVASSTAPVTPGSKAVVAALLDQNAATVLWDSFTGPTSDVSVAIRAYYLAETEGFNAKVTAEMDTIYEHYSRVQNQQKNFTRRQLRKIADDLRQEGSLKIEVFDNSAAGIDSESLQKILDLVTDKLIEVMFDTETGWSREPEREVGVEPNQILGRQKRSWLARTFGGTKDTKYYSDDQYVVKKRSDIRRNRFYLDLSKRGVIKVPVDTAGNLGGLYDELGEDERFFRIISLNDTTFARRDIRFQIDGAFADSFGEIFDFAAVTVEHEQADGTTNTTDLFFSYDDVRKGQTIQTATLLRLGDSTADWSDYRFRTVWGGRGDMPSLRIPRKEEDWIETKDLGVSLAPPLKRTDVEVDIDPSVIGEEMARAIAVEFASEIGGRVSVIDRVRVREGDKDLSQRASMFHDPEARVAWRMKVYGQKGQYTSSFRYFDGDFIYVGSLSDDAIKAAIGLPEDVEGDQGAQ